MMNRLTAEGRKEIEQAIGTEFTDEAWEDVVKVLEFQLAKLCEGDIREKIAEWLWFQNQGNAGTAKWTEVFETVRNHFREEADQITPLLNARVEEVRKEWIKELQTTLDFAERIAKHFDECRDSRIFFIMQQAFGDIDWEETEDTFKTVISQVQALTQADREDVK